MLKVRFLAVVAFSLAAGWLVLASHAQQPAAEDPATDGYSTPAQPDFGMGGFGMGFGMGGFQPGQNGFGMGFGMDFGMGFGQGSGMGFGMNFGQGAGMSFGGAASPERLLMDVLQNFDTNRDGKLDYSELASAVEGTVPSGATLTVRRSYGAGGGRMRGMDFTMGFGFGAGM